MGLLRVQRLRSRQVPLHIQRVLALGVGRGPVRTIDVPPLVHERGFWQAERLVEMN